MAEEAAQRQLLIQKIYLKDVSLEVPKAPEIFQRPWKPDVDLNLATATQALEQADTWQVVLTITLTAKLDGDTALLIELQQAGLFQLRGFTDADRTTVLNTYCPQTLFPYAREAISDIAQRGGFQQLLLQPVNFDALYQQHLSQQGKATDGAAATVQ